MTVLFVGGLILFIIGMAVVSYGTWIDESNPIIVGFITITISILLVMSAQIVRVESYAEFLEDFYQQQTVIENMTEPLTDEDYKEISKTIELNEQLKDYQTKGKATNLQPIKLPH